MLRQARRIAFSELCGPLRFERLHIRGMSLEAGPPLLDLIFQLRWVWHSDLRFSREARGAESPQVVKETFPTDRRQICLRSIPLIDEVGKTLQVGLAHGGIPVMRAPLALVFSQSRQHPIVGSLVFGPAVGVVSEGLGSWNVMATDLFTRQTAAAVIQVD